MEEYLKNLRRSTNWDNFLDLDKIKRSKSFDSLVTINECKVLDTFEDFEGKRKLSLQSQNKTAFEEFEEKKNKRNEKEKIPKSCLKNNQITNYEPYKICNVTVPKTLVHTASFYAERGEGNGSMDVGPPSPRNSSTEFCALNQTDEYLGERRALL